ncbi:hypothetical protein N9A94_04305 [Akkermansiaceae bacterium]|nr:hypothetical protein [Akkermansiaceae bacterium]MDB4537163.1 hypothetical protein [Akkermansiaceae bacterium]
MGTQKHTLFKRWRENFGKGIYALVILAMAGFVVQIASLVVVAIVLMAFPELDDISNSGIATFFGFLGFVIAGIPLFGFLFTCFYERETDIADKDVETTEANHQSQVTK